MIYQNSVGDYQLKSQIVFHIINIENLKHKTLFQISIDELNIDWNNQKLIDECGNLFDKLFNEKTP